MQSNPQQIHEQEARRKQIDSFVNETMRSRGCTYDEAWQLAKKQRAELFANMRTPTTKQRATPGATANPGATMFANADIHLLVTQ